MTFFNALLNNKFSPKLVPHHFFQHVMHRYKAKSLEMNFAHVDIFLINHAIDALREISKLSIPLITIDNK